MKKLFILIFIVSLHSVAMAQQMEEKVNYLSTRYMEHALWSNPAMTFDKHKLNITTITLSSFIDKNEQASIAENGFGGKEFSFYADTYVALDNNDKVYGSAYYKTETVNNILWNENIDYSIVYPYVVGDSLGGDMNIETYFFRGGYVKRFDNNYTFGAEMTYRAAIGFRNVDPRPHNTVSDLDVKIGISRLFDKYSLALSLSGRVYKQNSSISYYADTGSTDVYQMLGLGYDYSRFSGDKTSSRYEGSQWGASIDFMQKADSGLKLSLGVTLFDLTKILTSLNYVPVNLVDETKINLDASYLLKLGNLDYGVQLISTYKHRAGTENILGEATDNVYPIISSSSPFTAIDFTNDFSIFISGRNNNDSWRWMITPSVGLDMIEQRYSSTTTRFYEITNMTTGVDMQSLWSKKRWIYKLNAGVDSSSSLNKDYSLTGLDTSTSVAQTLLSNINYLSDEYFRYSVSAEINYILNSDYALSLSTSFTQINYSEIGVKNLFYICLGLKF